MSFIFPKQYTRGEMEDTATKSAQLFKDARERDEQKWAGFYDKAFRESMEKVGYILEQSDALTKLEEVAADLFGGDYLETLRYMDRPTVSNDDFINLTPGGTSSKTKLADEDAAREAMEFIIRNLNDNLFPWYAKKSQPSDADLLAAKRSIAALMADQKTKTKKRGQSSKKQESLVREGLVREAGYEIVPGHDIKVAGNAPGEGEVFATETSINDVKADVVLGLHDGRFMALECKVSNSTVNSYKRLNHEASDKVKKWSAMFGSSVFVGGAVLQGIYSVGNLMEAQEDGTSIFWSMDLKPLIDFVKQAK
jgi:hypothetical protein